jgi:hypothetical protein
MYSARQTVEKGPPRRFTPIGSAYHIPVAMTSGGGINCPRIVPSCHHDDETALPTDLLPVSVRAMHANDTWAAASWWRRLVS